ncbi:CvpA family protein [Thermovibrio ammonificans]|uniref:Colicin V production protein n=1 Tax=Thermovibrio ammonificans (strain DSM 15698 / JCM 12110 / HB-1) TaxID=648996 RepID=E8T387_THEA1|nr:CvpA family protein [Thermovibrio ammonificans]ADU97219.1 Colicin V production protein [Thermovibrio ammonificans HB-1]
MGLPTMNVLDGLIIIILGWNLIRGFNKGLVEELLSLSGMVVSLYGAYKLTPFVAKKLVGYADPTTLLFTGAVVYTVLYLVAKYFASLIDRKVRKTALNFINNVLGFFFGIFRGYFIAAVIVFIVAVISPDGYLIKRSSLGGMTVPLINKALEYLPDMNKKVLRNWRIAEGYLVRNWYRLIGKAREEAPRLKSRLKEEEKKL